MPRPLAALLALALLSLVGTAAEPDPNQPYSATRSDPVTYDIDFRVIVTAPQNTKKLRVRPAQVHTGQAGELPVPAEVAACGFAGRSRSRKRLTPASRSVPGRRATRGGREVGQGVSAVARRRICSPDRDRRPEGQP